MDTTGSWALPDEYVMLQGTVRRFMEDAVRPLEDAAPHDAVCLAPAVLAPLQKRARDLGLWCKKSPAEYGGAGLRRPANFQGK